MAYHVESFIVCDACHGCRVSMPGHNGRDVLEREAARRGWQKSPCVVDGLQENFCRECVLKGLDRLCRESA